MKLTELTTRYIDFKRATGMRFGSEAWVLRAFCRAMGDIDINAVRPEAVLIYIAGDGPVTSFWHHKFKILNGFYRYAIARGYTHTSPLPTTVPQCPPPHPPYIYTVDELRRLLAATDRLHTPTSPLQAITFRTLLLLLYGTGVRIGEALALTLADVDLRDSLLLVRDSKFCKTRVVPAGPKLTAQLETYAQQRRQRPCPTGEGSAFFATRTGHPLFYTRVNRVFQQLRTWAGIQRQDGARYQPRLHDLRHTAAVTRVVAWYRAGADLQRLLPQLATYLGHTDITGTQRYLTMTPELLDEASRRFERYAFSEDHHG